MVVPSASVNMERLKDGHVMSVICCYKLVPFFPFPNQLNKQLKRIKR